MGTVKYSGPVASFHCPTEATIRSLKVHFSPKQLGSGTPSPENVREIEGWDGVEVEQSGKNLFPSDISFYEFPTTAWISSSMSPDFVFANGEYSGTVPAGKRDWTVMITKHTFAPGTYTISFDYINGVESMTWQPVVLTYHNGGGWYSGLVGMQAVNDTSGHREKTFTATQPFYISLSLHSFGSTTKEGFNKIYNLQLEKNSTATTYEPYHGSTTNYEFGVLGKNKFDPNCDMWNYSVYSKNGDEITQSGSDGRGWTDANLKSISLKAGTYTLTCSDENNFNLRTSIDNYEANISLINGGGSFTLSQDCDVKIKHSVKSGNSYPTTFTVQLELGSTATTYEPYDPNKTVYGGWVDLVSGEVCEEYSRFTPDENSNITVISSDTYKQFRFWDAEAIKTRLSGYCSHFKLYANPNGYGVTALDYLGTACQLILQQDSSVYVETVADLKSWLQAQREAGTPFHIVFERAEPNYYHLPPHSTALKTFLSANNVWSNADYVEVEYDLHETQDILARKQFIMANQPHVVSPAAAPLQNFNTDMAAPLKECKVYFEPVQDLHGYSKPWVGGSGKNQLDINAVEYGTYDQETGLPITSTYQYQVRTTYDILVNAGDSWISSNNVAHNCRCFFWDINDNYIGQLLVKPNIAFTIPNNATKMRLISGADPFIESEKWQLEKGSTATSYEPYKNICPIEGLNSIETIQTGKNLFDINFFKDKTNVTVSENTISGYVTPIHNVTYEKLMPLKIPKNSTFTTRAITYRSSADTGAGWSFWFVYSNGERVRPFYTSNSVITPTEYKGTLIAEEDIIGLDFGYYNQALTGIWYLSDVQIEINSSNTVYEEYNNNTINVTFPFQNKNLFSLDKNDWTVNSTYRYMKFTENPNDDYCLSFDIKDSTINMNDLNIHLGFMSHLPINSAEAGKGYNWVINGNNNIGSQLLNKTTYPSNDEQQCSYIVIYPNTDTAWEAVNARFNIQLEKGSTPTTYVPSNRTVYGGYIDLIKGKLVQTHKKVTIGELSWRTVPSLGEGGWTTDSHTPSDMSRAATPISTIYKTINWQHSWSLYQSEEDYSISRYSPSDNLTIVIKDSRYSTVADFVAAQGDTEIVYELATPIEYSIDPQTLKTLRGTNNIWSNSNGDITVQFWKH